MWKLLLVATFISGCSAGLVPLAFIPVGGGGAGPSSEEVARKREAEERRARDRAAAIALFQLAIGLTEDDRCADVVAAMAEIQTRDRTYFESIAGDPGVAWCTTPGAGRSIELTRRARDLAAGGDCAGSIALAPSIRAEDRAYYGAVYQQHPAIVKCWITWPEVVTTIVDTRSLQLAAQARSALRRNDCAGARASTKHMPDRLFARVFEARELGSCS